MPIILAKKSLLELHRSVKRGVVMFCDLLITVLSVWLTFVLLLGQWGSFQGNQWFVLIAALIFSFPLFVFFGLYRAIFRYIGTTAFLSVVRVFTIYGAIFFSIFTLIGIDDLPVSIGVIQPILLFIGIGASRFFMRYWLGGIKNTFDCKQAVALIYGAGSVGRELANTLSGNQEMIVKAFIDDDYRLYKSTINGIPIYPADQLSNLISRFEVTDVLLAIPSVSHRRKSEIIGLLNGYGVRVRTLPSLIDLAAGRIRVSDLHDIDMNDLLGRPVVPPNVELLEKNIREQVVLVTGAGGSIGSELCRQIMKFSPKSLILIDTSEHSLYLIYEELKKTQSESSENSSLISSLDLSKKLVPCLASVRDKRLLSNIFRVHQPATVFHAAAYKHVPLVEQNPAEGVRNNVFGTLTCVEASLECGVSNFILVSTDKAVRPTNIMGASKRIAELILQAMADLSVRDNHPINFSMVRFGNVLGSSGSVAPLFSAQIASGGPITLTHPEVTRYFMTITEAAQLVIQASALATGGDVFVLDMGEPVRIYDLAIRMIYLSGFMVKDVNHPHGDIEIHVTGLRPGEKLYEELLIGEDPKPTTHSKIMKAHEDFLPWESLQAQLAKLNLALDAADPLLLKDALQNLVPQYHPNVDLTENNAANL